jgi:hypothetical protein
MNTESLQLPLSVQVTLYPNFCNVIINALKTLLDYTHNKTTNFEFISILHVDIKIWFRTVTKRVSSTLMMTE